MLKLTTAVDTQLFTDCEWKASWSWHSWT